LRRLAAGQAPGRRFLDAPRGVRNGRRRGRVCVGAVGPVPPIRTPVRPPVRVDADKGAAMEPAVMPIEAVMPAEVVPPASVTAESAVWRTETVPAADVPTTAAEMRTTTAGEMPADTAAGVPTTTTAAAARVRRPAAGQHQH